MFGTTSTYIITVVGPIGVCDDNLISYNKYPIVCISKNGIDNVWHNELVKESILETIKFLGTELIDNSFVYMRIVDHKASITDKQWPLKEILEKWN